MKRVLSLILVLVLALGSVPFAFAADMTSGQELKELGLVKGDSEGNLNEEGMLTRAEMMVMISRLLGVEEEAMNYAIPSTSKDVEGHWAAKYIAYAEQVGNWTSGVGENMFGADEKVTTQMAAKFMLTALGYEANWDTAVADAQALGLMVGVSSEATANITRGEVFTTSLNTVNTPKKDSEVTLGVSLGVVKEEVVIVAMLDGAVIDTVKSVGNDLVEITFEDDVDAAAAANVANYGVTEKLTTSNVIVINNVVVNDTDRVTLETAALKLGVAYTLTFDGESTNFSGLAVDKDVPEVNTVKGTDTGIVEVEFKEALMDTATAEDIANYSIDKEGTVVKAELQADRKTVELTIEGLTTTTAKKLTIENVLSVDKVAVKKITKVFFPKYDKFAPKFAVDTTSRKNNVTVTLKVTDEHGIDEATAEDIANYSIDGLSVTKAEAKKNVKTDKYLNRIVLTTSEQTNGKSYSLKINNLVDGSNAKNAIAKEISETFRGAAADKTKPVVQKVTAKTTTTINVTFTENNDLDATSALNPANYVLDKSDFQILEAKFLDDETDSKVIVLTTSTQPSKKANFKLTISNVSDEFNNTMKEVSRFFSSTVEDTTKPEIVGIASTGKTDEVKVTFKNEIEKATAVDPTNYSADQSIGSPVEAKLDTAGKIVTLTFDGLAAGDTYELTVKNITNLYDVTMDEKTTDFIAAREEADTTQPEVDSYYVTNQNELRITFDEKVSAATGAVVTVKTGTEAAKTFTYQARLADEKTLVYKMSTSDATAAKDKEFTVETLTNVTDTAGNAFVYDTDNKFTLADIGSGDKIEAKLLSWAQSDLKTFTLYFDKEVSLKDTSLTTFANVALTGTTTTFTLEVDEDDFTIVTAKASNPLDSEFAGSVNLKNEINDIIGDSVEDEVITLEGGLIDETEPNIVSVIPTNKYTVEVTYDEDMGTTGGYKIVEEGKTTNLVSSTSVKDEVVTIILSSNLDEEKVYELTQTTNLARDIAKKPNKANESGTYTFVGVENDATKIYFIGADVVNGTNVTLKASEKFLLGETVAVTGSAVTLSSATGYTTTAVLSNTKTIKLMTADATPFMSGTTYTVTVTVAATTKVAAYDVVVKFDGLVKELAIDTVSTTVGSTTTVTNTLIDFEHNEDFTYTLNGAAGTVTVDEDGLVNATAITSAAGTNYTIIVKLGSNVVYTTKTITK